MEIAEDIFVREDLSKPENRVNLALFSLMQQDWFRKWTLRRLRLPTDAVVYPPENIRGRRPDFMVKSEGSEVAVIEVELGKNHGQAEDYRAQFAVVKTIWGTREHGGDLSLEEIAEVLGRRRRLSAQTKFNVAHLIKLIDEGLSGHSRSSARGNVSEEMWNHWLVEELRNRLGDRLDATTGQVGIGSLKADTIGKEGFSLKVRRLDRSGEVAVLSITRGTHLVFPSRRKLNRCLPNLRAEVDDYMRLVASLNCDVEVDGDNARPRIALEPNREALIGKVGEIERCVRALAG